MLFNITHITRSNYEEFFLLYTDNELGSREREMVEKFVSANPDLKDELDVLLDTRLPKENFSIDKSSLVRKEVPLIDITDQNYQEYFLLYIDNELSPEERKEVEKFVLQHPEYASEFSYLQRSVLTPEKVLFEHKEILYQEPEPARVVSFKVWRWVAAAAIIILGGILIGRIGFNRTETPPVVQYEQENTPAVSPQPKNQKNIAVNELPKEKIIQSQTTKENTRPVHKKLVEKFVAQKIKNPEKRYTEEEKSSNEAIASDINNTPKTNEVRTNNLPQRQTDNTVASIDIPGINNPVNTVPVNTQSPKKSLTENDPAISNTTITYSVYNMEPEKNDLLTINDQELRKSGLKGFFRKAKRLLERRANINTGDENNVLIGGFEIALRNGP